jgi:hypothetical protein
MRPQASEGEVQHGAFAGVDVSVKDTSALHCGRDGQDHKGSEGSERIRCSAAGTEACCLPLQADRTRSWTVVVWLFSVLAEADLPGDLC